MSFASYSIASMLNTMGWPQEQGTFRRRAVVSTQAVEMAVDHMVKTCAGLGAGDPVVAAELLQNSVPQWDYVARPPDTLLTFLQSDATDPVDPLHPYRVVFGGQPALASIPPSQEYASWDEVFDNGPNQIWFAMLSGRAIVWGLAHPSEMRAAVIAQIDDYNEGVKEAIDAGLDLPGTHPHTGITDGDTFYSFLVDCAASVDDYERDVQPLAPPPPILLTARLFATRLPS